MIKKSFLFYLCLLLPLSVVSEENIRWVIDYGKTLDFDKFDPYSIVVLNENPSPMMIEMLREQDKEVFGHINLSQINSTNRFYQMAKKEGVLLESKDENTGSNLVDIKQKAWTKMMIEWIIPYALLSRFDGLLIDGVDNYLNRHQEGSQAFTADQSAFIRLIKTIRLHYPQKVIILKNGYTVLPEVAKEIDMEIVEASYGRYNAKEKKYELVPDEAYKKYLDELKAAREHNPNLKILTLDYWSPDDSSTIKQIYEKQRKQGFIPYVSSYEKDIILPEPN